MRRINRSEMRRENVSDTEGLVGFAAQQETNGEDMERQEGILKTDSREAKEYGLHPVGCDFQHKEP